MIAYSLHLYNNLIKTNLKRNFVACTLQLIIIFIYIFEINFMNQSPSQYVDGLHHLEYRHLEEVIALLAKSFLKHNQIWSQYPLSKQELNTFFRQVVADHLQLEQRAQQYTNKDFHVNMIYVLKGKIVSVLLHYEIEQYRLKSQLTSKPPSIELFRRLQKYGKQLLKGIDLNILQKGQHVYGNFGATDNDNLPPKYVNLIVFEYCAYLRSKGIKSMIGRTSNIKANVLYQKLGGKVLKMIKFKEDGIAEPMSLLYFDSFNPIFNKLIESRSKIPKQKMIVPKL